MRRANTRSGYTLVEVLIAMVAGVMVLGGIYQLLTQNQRVYKAQAELADAQQTVRTAMDIMTRDIRHAGADPSKTIFGGVAADNTYGMPLKNTDAISVQMDLGRDANGDGDSWDIQDSPTTPNGQIDYGDPSERGEDEFGDGVVGDTNPDEWVTYFYCVAPGSQAGVQDIDLDGSDDINCPADSTLRLYRMVTYYDANDTLDVLTEPLADYIEPEPNVSIFEYLCDGTTCNLANSKPQVVQINLRGRTRGPDPSSQNYKYFELQSQVRMMNLGASI